VRLNPLCPSEVHDYMAHRLEIVGGSTRLFSRTAIDAIASASGGVPRNVNTICFNSLTLAYAMNKRQVGCDEVSEVLRDLRLPGDEPAPSPESPLTFSQVGASLRPAWITAGVLLLAAGLAQALLPHFLSR
jgi:hypothetical protein